MGRWEKIHECQKDAYGSARELLRGETKPPLSWKRFDAAQGPHYFVCRDAGLTEAVLVLLGPEWVYSTLCLLKQDGKGL